MTTDELEDIYKHYANKYHNLLITKGREYAPAGDRLQNFKDAAGLAKETPLKALHGMWVKHIISITAKILEFSSSKNPQDPLYQRHDPSIAENMNVWEEKIGDNILYSFLMLALLHEMRKDNEDKMSKV